MLPELGEGAEDGGFGYLFAELGCEVVGGEARVFCLPGEESVGVQRERGDFGGAAGGGGLLPGFVAAEGEDVLKGERGDEKVWSFGADAGGVAEKVERDRTSVEDEA